jgi:TDG/mug DNA glycosylase family protein
VDEYPVRDRAFRPGAADLEAARDRVVPAVLPPAGAPVRVLFCGINPGLYTAATGWHFARPGNRFWPALHGSGFTETLLHPSEQDVLAAAGHGITNLVARPTARADELSPAELVEGGRRLAERAVECRPAFVAVVGIGAYRVAFAEPRAAIGPQDRRIGPAAVWVLPNPSGLNAHYPLPKIIAEFARLRVAASEASAV